MERGIEEHWICYVLKYGQKMRHSRADGTPQWRLKGFGLEIVMNNALKFIISVWVHDSREFMVAKWKGLSRIEADGGFDSWPDQYKDLCQDHSTIDGISNGTLLWSSDIEVHSPEYSAYNDTVMYCDMCCHAAPFLVEAIGEKDIKIDNISKFSNPSFILQRGRQYCFEGEVQGLAFWVEKKSNQNSWRLDKGKYFKFANRPEPRLSAYFPAFLKSANFEPDDATVLVRYARLPPGRADCPASPLLLPGGYLKFIQASPV
jgi:hypothetical protein